MVYVFVLIISLYGLFKYDLIGLCRGRKAFFIFEYIVLIVVVGLRNKIGGDNFYYLEYWQTYPKMIDIYTFDFKNAEFQPLWYVFNAFIKSIFDNYVCFQIVHAVLINWIVSNFIWKYSKLPFFSTFVYILFFYFYYNTEILRASISVCIILLSYPSLENKNWLKYYVYVIIAFGFHLSAIVAVLFPACHLFKDLHYKWIFGFVILGFLIVYMENFIPYVIGLFSNSELIAIKIENYFLRVESDSYSGYNIVGWSVWFLYTIMVPFIILYYSNNIKNSLFRGFVFLWVFFNVLIGGYGTLVVRTMDYIYPIFIIIYSNVICLLLKLPNRRYDIKLKFIIMFVLLITSYEWGRFRYFRPLAYGKFYQLYYPYTSIFDSKDPVERENLLFLFRESNVFN